MSVVKANETAPDGLYVRAEEPGKTTYRRATGDELARAFARGTNPERELTNKEYDEFAVASRCRRTGEVPMWRTIRGFDSDKRRPFEVVGLVAIPAGYRMRRVRRPPSVCPEPEPEA